MRRVPATVVATDKLRAARADPSVMNRSWASTAFRVAMRFRTLTHMPPATEAKHRGTVNTIAKVGS
jgi:hypothetical protein